MAAYAIERDPLLADAGTDTLAKRVEVVLGTLASRTGTPCRCCARILCPHDALASLVFGFQRDPRCSACLSDETRQDAATLRDEVTAFALSKECLTIGWRWAAERDSRCEWSNAHPPIREPIAQVQAAPSSTRALHAPGHETEWNAGDLACGELVLELRGRLRAMSPGCIIKVTALDPAAPEDIPAWCRLTGHTLVYSKHPQYFIRRKED